MAMASLAADCPLSAGSGRCRDYRPTPITRKMMIASPNAAATAAQTSRATRGVGALVAVGRTGVKQFRQNAALSLSSFPHSKQVMRALKQCRE